MTEAEPPGVAALGRLHRAFVERVPYEAVEIQLGRLTPLDPLVSADRIVRLRRGGYCFHLNGALAELLRALGYRVALHPGGVQGHPDSPAGVGHGHLALTVRDLPDSDEVWLVDAGMGDGPHSPLPLREGVHRQGPFTFRLRRSEVTDGWRFDHDPRGGFHGMDFSTATARMADFADKHLELSTSPESGFVRTFGVLRVDGGGRDVLRALTLSRISGTTTSTVLEREADWSAALADVFGLTFPAHERKILWAKAVAQHEAHVSPTVNPSS
ncbi:arylamine N-acetyltransferase family protein [Saccharothrix coeruleofusca]|uniref:arylamine N-acetyltransferase family protein n=1 Tax=Saccharothrix coeruleofusca TaxID=33919 RepID=UPI00278BFEF2|nr:arylamine N-acetyltransferase [Saccharothrix coeruleofusca]MBP2338716.1 arylamine N-acetyltransferase [Saccharothrix coeruleofusca]